MVNLLLYSSILRPVRFPVYVLIPLVLPVCTNVVICRHLWLHERSLRFPGCAQWCVVPSDLRSVPGIRTNERAWADGRVHPEKVEFKDSGITVVGVAPDSIAAVKTFATKHNVTVRELRSPPFLVLHVILIFLMTDDSTRC
jgi:hypothetical protein